MTSRFKKTKWDSLIENNPFSIKKKNSNNAWWSLMKSVRQIITINAIVFFVLWAVEIILPTFHMFLVTNLAVPTDWHIITKPWTILTSAFTHIGLMHIVFNMLAIYMFSPLLKRAFNDKQIWNIYILGHLCGVICSISINILLGNKASFALGASCGVAALTIATCYKYPRIPVNFFFFPTTLKWVAYIFIAQSVYLLFTPNMIGGLGHLFGMVLGYFYVKELEKNNDIGKVFNIFNKIKKLKFKSKPVYKSTCSPETEKIIRNMFKK